MFDWMKKVTGRPTTAQVAEPVSVREPDDDILKLISAHAEYCKRRNSGLFWRLLQGYTGHRPMYSIPSCPIQVEDIRANPYYRMTLEETKYAHKALLRNCLPLLELMRGRYDSSLVPDWQERERKMAVEVFKSIKSLELLKGNGWRIKPFDLNTPERIYGIAKSTGASPRGELYTLNEMKALAKEEKRLHP